MDVRAHSSGLFVRSLRRMVAEELHGGCEMDGLVEVVAAAAGLYWSKTRLLVLAWVFMRPAGTR